MKVRSRNPEDETLLGMLQLTSDTDCTISIEEYLENKLTDYVDAYADLQFQDYREQLSEAADRLEFASKVIDALHEENRQLAGSGFCGAVLNPRSGVPMVESQHFKDAFSTYAETFNGETLLGKTYATTLLEKGVSEETRAIELLQNRGIIKGDFYPATHVLVPVTKVKVDVSRTEPVKVDVPWLTQDDLAWLTRKE